MKWHIVVVQAGSHVKPAHVHQHWGLEVASREEVDDAYRKANDVQYNRPNPAVDETKFREIYEDVDSSSFDPATANEEEWGRIYEWRKRMDKAVEGLWGK